MSDLEVETGALNGVGTHLTVGNGHVIGMDGIALEGFLRLEGAVEHHVGIGGCQTSVDVNLYVKETRHFAYESFQTFFNTCLNGLLLLFGEFWIQCPENNVLNHNLKYLREFKMHSFIGDGMDERDSLCLEVKTVALSAVEFVALDRTA